MNVFPVKRLLITMIKQEMYGSSYRMLNLFR
jgi:hypothetical protein